MRSATRRPPRQDAVAQSQSDLASRFSPSLQFASGERFYPTSVDYILSSSSIKDRSSGSPPDTVDSSPTPSNLGEHTSPDLFLDNKLGGFDAIAADYTAKAHSIDHYAYVRTVESGSETVIQYWLFYAYNNGPINDHQGDIEVIEVFLDGSGNPSRLLLSQHAAGQNAMWSDVEKVDGTHPVVYVAQGSHANYFRSYQGKLGLENDAVGGGVTISPSQLKLVTLGESGNHPEDQSWLDFQGRWGYWGSDSEVALGMAGPVGPVFNQNGIRWASPDAYLGTTFAVDNNYLLLSLVAGNLFLIMAVYLVARGVWKLLSIVKMVRSGGLLVGKFLKSKGGVGFIIGILGILVTLAALSMPWYTISASSESGPLANQQGDVEIMNVDGLNGLRVNMFLGSDEESTSGYRTLFSSQVPFAILIGAGLVLVILDVIGVMSGKKLGRKFIFGAITLLIPFILIYLFIMQLPTLLPMASSLLPGQSIPPEVESMVRDLASNPISGSTTQVFQEVGATTVNWGFGIGAYLFIVAAIMRIIGGIMMRAAPDLNPEPKKES